jgi:hypothetical protein
VVLPGRAAVAHRPAVGGPAVDDRVLDEVVERELEEVGVRAHGHAVGDGEGEVHVWVVLADVSEDAREEVAEGDVAADRVVADRAFEPVGLLAEVDEALGLGDDVGGAVGGLRFVGRRLDELGGAADDGHVVAEVVPDDAVEDLEALLAAAFEGDVLEDEGVADVGAVGGVDGRRGDRVAAFGAVDGARDVLVGAVEREVVVEEHVEVGRGRVGVEVEDAFGLGVGGDDAPLDVDEDDAAAEVVDGGALAGAARCGRHGEHVLLEQGVRVEGDVDGERERDEVQRPVRLELEQPREADDDRGKGETASATACRRYGSP